VLHRLRPTLSVVTLVAACLGAGPAHAALRLDSGTSHESMVVDARGTVAVTYTTGGRSRTVVVSGSSVRYGGAGVTASPAAQRVAPTVPFALVQISLPDGRQFALQRLHRTGQFGVLGPEELFIARWRGAPTRLTLMQSGGRLCGTVTYHGVPVYGGAHTPTGDPLDALGRNVYLDALRPSGWYRLLGVLTRPRGFALALTADRRGSRYRALVVGPNVAGDLAPVASASTPAHPPAHPAACPFPPGTYAGA
jgi:hypothetical protein